MRMASKADCHVNAALDQSSSILALSPRGLEEQIQGPNRLLLPLDRDSGKLAFTLENVLSPCECEALINAAESSGFASAGLGAAGEQEVVSELRDSGRLISNDPLLARQIFDRIRPHLPTIWRGRRILGLNEQLKFLRYRPGQKFVAHFDGAFCRPGTPNKTCLTVMLYLSRQQSGAGGSTRFVGSDDGSFTSCVPAVGRALVFQHNILHEGEEVNEGVKYTIRTDVEYGGVTFWGQLQEALGFGGTPCEQHFRTGLAFCVGIFAVAMAHFRL